MKKSFIKAMLCVFTLLYFSACSEEKVERQAAPPSDAGTAGDGDGSGTAPISGPARTKSQCEAENKSWIAVVENGQKPSTCSAPISEWGCCIEQVMARFPRLAQTIDDRYKKNVSEGYSLYHCSTTSEREHALHFAQFPGDGSVLYREISIPTFAYEPEGAVKDCPKFPVVNFPTGGTGTAPPVSSDGSGGGGTNAATFAQVNNIIKTSCGTSACHGSGSSQKVYVDNEANLKANQASILDRITRPAGDASIMPPSAQGTLTADQIRSLESYFE